MDHIEMLKDILRSRKMICFEPEDERSSSRSGEEFLITVRESYDSKRLHTASIRTSNLREAIEGAYKATFPAPSTTFGRLKHLIDLKETSDAEFSDAFKSAVAEEHRRVSPKI